MAEQYPLARKGGLLGPTIEKSLQMLHAREIAKSMLTGGAGVPSFQEGGVVPYTGIFKLHEGETVVPGQTTGTTPPFMPSAGGGVDEQTKKILQMLVQSASRKQFAGQPRPSPVPGKQDPFGAPSYMTSGPNPHAWGAQRLMFGIQSMMKNAVAHHKEEQVNKAMADWEYAQSSLNEYYNAQSSGDQVALAAAQKKLDVVFGDPKKLKNMAKALNQDWLNPEKTTVYGEALKKVASQTQQKDGQKQQAKQGIMGMFKKLIGERQQKPQLSPDDQKRMEQEIISKAPTQVVNDPKLLQFMETYEGKLQVQKMKDDAAKEIEQMKETAKKETTKPVDKVLSEAAELYGKGDMEGYKKKLAEANQMSMTTKAPAKDSEISLIQKANAGDKDALKALTNLRSARLELAKQRGMGRPMNFYDPVLKRDVVLSAEEGERRQQAGESLVMTGPVPANQVINTQRAQNSIPKAVGEVEKYITAWDNEKDRAIFAKIIKDSPMAGEPETWFSNVINQALAGKLSPEGRQATIALRRLGEAMGTVRAASGLPSTAGSMMATWAMLPGAQTPDSKFAKDQLQSIMDLMQQETGLAFFGGAENAPAAKPAKGATGAGGGKQKVIVVKPEDMN